jgi:rRNA maturation endonuclease Nob1
MLLQCQRCRLVVEAAPDERCKNCGDRLVVRSVDAPVEVLDHAKTTKTPSKREPIRHD